MKKKIKKHKFSHELDGKNRMLIVSAVSNVDAIQSVTYEGVGGLDLAKRKKYFIFDKKFPFIHRKEIGVYYAKLDDKKGATK